MKKQTAITINTCEGLAQEEKASVIQPNNEQSFELFPFNDPFLLRKAIVPVFIQRKNGEVIGAGTAFHIDGWGSFITAGHVVDEVLEHIKLTQNNELHYTVDSQDNQPQLLLCAGLVFGKTPLPAETIAPVRQITLPLEKTNNPLDELQGRANVKLTQDIAVLRINTCYPERMNATLPIRFTGKKPLVGENVVAIGYPTMKCEPINKKEMRKLYMEGMFAAYGKIREIKPKGRVEENAHSKIYTTPIIEIEANWPAGMSGGPVFNTHGEVIGIVGKSILPEKENGREAGIGSAIALDQLLWLQNWIPSICIQNPGWRQGWGLFDDATNEMIHCSPTHAIALNQQKNWPSKTTIAYCKNKIGTNEYIKQKFDR